MQHLDYAHHGQVMVIPVDASPLQLHFGSVEHVAQLCVIVFLQSLGTLSEHLGGSVPWIRQTATQCFQQSCVPHANRSESGVMHSTTA
jgi:hypothetical protein